MMMNCCHVTNSVSYNEIHPLFFIYTLDGSWKILSTIPILILCLIGLIENIFAFQTFLFSCINGKLCLRHLVYLLILSFNGLLISIVLPIGIVCSISKEFIKHINLCDIFILLSIVINTFSLWISSALSIDSALFNIYVGTMRALSYSYAVVISILLMLFVSGSYVSWMINEAFSINIISAVCSLFHLSVPCLIHTTGSILCLKYSIRRRMNLLKEKTSYLKQLLAHQEYLRPLVFVLIGTIPYLFIVILICYDQWGFARQKVLSSEIQLLLITFMLPPQMLTFNIYILPRKTFMREYRNISPIGKLLGKIYSKKKSIKNLKILQKKSLTKKY